MDDPFDPVLHKTAPAMSAILQADAKYGEHLHVSMEDPVAFLRSQRSYYIKGKYLPMERTMVIKDLQPGEYITPTAEFISVVATVLVNAMKEVLTKHNTLDDSGENVAITGIIDPKRMQLHMNKIINVCNMLKPRENGKMYIYNDLLVFLLCTAFIETSAFEAINVEPYIQIDDYMNAMYDSMDKFREAIQEPIMGGMHPEHALALQMLTTALTCVPSMLERVNESVFAFTNETMN
jgi:hypothetical protein